jgi:hypothetical protein
MSIGGKLRRLNIVQRPLQEFYLIHDDVELVRQKTQDLLAQAWTAAEAFMKSHLTEHLYTAQLHQSPIQNFGRFLCGALLFQQPSESSECFMHGMRGLPIPHRCFTSHTHSSTNETPKDRLCRIEITNPQTGYRVLPQPLIPYRRMHVLL